MHKVGPGDVGEHGENFGFEFQDRTVEYLYRYNHGLPRSDQSFVMKDAEPGAGVKGLFLQFIKFYGFVSGGGNGRVLFDLGDPGAVDRRYAADIDERLDVLISPAVREESLHNAFLFCCESAFPFSYPHGGDLPPDLKLGASRK